MANLDAVDELAQSKVSGLLELENLTKTFGSGGDLVTAVDGACLTTEAGEFITLLGPSGCGKTTTLRMIAGFESPSNGQVRLDGKDMIQVPPNRRPMAMVFQSYALFPHLSVRENVAYGLKLQRIAPKEIHEQVDLALSSMNLLPLADRQPNQLSGGQQQRVALARAMVMRPKVLLFDEPLSNLDAKLRGQMRLEIRRLQRRLNITSVYVTHDQAEAMAMSDRIVVMNGGRIEQAAAPEIIYRRPASVFVADFIGRANFIGVSAASPAGHGRAVIEALDERLEVPSHPDALEADEQVLLVRPESLRLQRIQADRNGLSGRIGRILATVFYGDYVEYEVEIEAGENLLVTESDPDVDAILTEGSSVRIDFAVERSWLLPNS